MAPLFIVWHSPSQFGPDSLAINFRAEIKLWSNRDYMASRGARWREIAMCFHWRADIRRIMKQRCRGRDPRELRGLGNEVLARLITLSRQQIIRESAQWWKQQAKLRAKAKARSVKTVVKGPAEEEPLGGSPCADGVGAPSDGALSSKAVSIDKRRQVAGIGDGSPINVLAIRTLQDEGSRGSIPCHIEEAVDLMIDSSSDEGDPREERRTSQRTKDPNLESREVGDLVRVLLKRQEIPDWLERLGPCGLRRGESDVKATRAWIADEQLRAKSGSNRNPCIALVNGTHELCLDNFQRVLSTRWLSDASVNAYLGLVQARNKKIHACPASAAPSWLPKVAFISSYFLPKLSKNSDMFNRYSYQGVRRWGQRAAKLPGLPLLQHDHIYFPCNLHNQHWVLLVVHPRLAAIEVYDPLPASPDNPRTQAICRLILKWVIDEAEAEGEYVPPVDEWRVTLATGHPHQRDSSSCGVFSIIFAERLSLGVRPRSFNFSQSDVQKLRNAIACDLRDDSLTAIEVPWLRPQ